MRTQLSFLYIPARLLSGVCTGSTCAAPTGLEAGMTTTCNDAGALDATCAFACEDGYTLSGTATSTCTADNGATTASYQGHLPICTGTISLRSGTVELEGVFVCDLILCYTIVHLIFSNIVSGQCVHSA